MTELAGKKIVLGITGGIAAYKAAELCRLLKKAGASVRVIMTDASTRFLAPLTMQTLSGAPVGRELVDAGEEAEIGHIKIADEADVIVVAPATANSIARFAGGLADDLLAAVVLASPAPVLLAPAMNVNMWRNPITQQNLGRLVGAGGGRFHTVGPDAGELACGWVGEGRLIDPAEIAAAAARLLALPTKGPGQGPGERRLRDLVDRRIVVTAGPTFEPIDEVRFVGNRSSGKMGFALAAAAARRGARVTLIAGPVALATPDAGDITRRDVETAAEMRAALAEAVPDCDVLVMAAAVADFRPATRIEGKLSRRAPASPAGGTAGASEKQVMVPLVANPDLLAEVARGRRGARPLLVGFAAETGRDAAGLVARAREKLAEKGCDVVVANDVGAEGIGFGSDENAVTLVFADGPSESLPRAAKTALADRLWDRLLSRIPAPRAKTAPASAVSSVVAPAQRERGGRRAAASRATGGPSTLATRATRGRSRRG